MEPSAEDESEQLGDIFFAIPLSDKLDVDMTVEEFIEDAIPLTEVLANSACVPEILVELAICKASELAEHVENSIEDEQKGREKEQIYRDQQSKFEK